MIWTIAKIREPNARDPVWYLADKKGAQTEEENKANVNA